MNKREQLAAKRAALSALQDSIKAGDAAAIEQGEALASEIETLVKAIDMADRASALLGKIGSEPEEDAEDEGAKARNLGDNFVQAVKSAQPGKRFSVNAPAFKAASDAMTTPAGITEFATTFDRAVVEAPRTALVIRDLFGAEAISGSTLVYLVEGAQEGAPAVIAEGAVKPQMHFADPTPVTVSLKKIAAHIKESDEYINDYAFLASAVNGRLLYSLGLIEQNTLVTDLLATSGIQTDATKWGSVSKTAELADLILQAAMDVQEQSGYAADAIVLNPAVWYQLRVAKTGDDVYYGGGFFGAQNVPNLWGIPVCVTTAVTASQIIVGAFKTCGSVVANGGVSVEATNTDQDDFIKNMMTIRVEERLALAVRRPAGFKLLTK